MTIASKYIEFSILRKLPLSKSDGVNNNWLEWIKRKFIKFSQVNFRKSYEILDHLHKSIRSYIKIFEAGCLLVPLPDKVGLKKNGYSKWLAGT